MTPRGADLLAFLVKLYAEQEHVHIKFKIEEKGSEK